MITTLIQISITFKNSGLCELRNFPTQLPPLKLDGLERTASSSWDELPLLDDDDADGGGVGEIEECEEITPEFLDELTRCNSVNGRLSNVSSPSFRLFKVFYR